jgi:hypothetical protein
MELYGSLLNISGSVTASTFTGSFIGDGSGLTGIQASGVVGLNLSQIATGSFTASLSPDGFNVNTDTSITGAVNITGSLLLNGQAIGDESVVTHIVTSPGGIYYIDGIANPKLSFVPGVTYRFNTTAVTGAHPFKFSTSPNGPTEYTTGVTSGVNFLQIEVGYDTTTTLYYYCTAHNNMGNEINILRVEKLLTTASFVTYTGSINTRLVSLETLSGSYTGSFSGSFNGDGTNLFNIPASGVTGLNLTQIADGSVTASVSNANGLRVNSKSEITGSLIVTNGITGSIDYSNLTNVPTLVSGSSQILSGSNLVSSSTQVIAYGFATTGSNTFVGNQTHSGSIIPSVDNTYDLGSVTHQWRDVYISSGSLYIDGTKVLASTAQELTITTDVGQSIKILEAGSDNIILQSADGDIQLKSSGGGNLLFDPTTGLIDVRGTLQIQDGNKITSSGGTNIQIGDTLGITGSIELTGDVDGIDLQSFSSSVSTSINSLLGGNTSLSSSIATTTSGLSSSIGSLSSSVATTTSGLSSSIGSLNSYTSSNTTNINAIHVFTSSLNSLSNSLNTAFELTGSNVTIKGNLAVQGTTTNVNTTTLNVDNNLINLNGNGAAFAGIRVNDTTAPNTISGSLLWDSTNDYWIAGQLGSEIVIATISGTQTLTNKTIDGSQLVDTSVTNTKLVNSSITIAGTSTSLGGTISAATILSGTGTVSGSAQVLAGTTIHSGSFFNGITVVSGSGQISFGGITDKPALVSGSAQISFNSISDKPTLVSGSSQISYPSLSNIPGGIVSGSIQIDLTATTNYSSGIKTRLNAEGVLSGSAQVVAALPSGTVSGSAQITLSSTTGYAAYDATVVHIAGDETITGIKTFANTSTDTLILRNTESQASGRGSWLTFQGYDGVSNRTYAYIAALKENSTSGNYASYLEFYTRPNGLAPQLALSIASNKNATFGGTISASNFSGTSSGTNTGDQTNISGNAATATFATTAGSTGTLSSNAVTSGYLVIGGNYSNNAFNSVPGGTRLMFGGGNSDAVENYYIGTNMEDVGGNYNKLDLRWHTGIRMGAQASYGGIRFYNNEDLTSVLFSIGNSDGNVRSHTNLLPSANNSYNLGSSSLRWANLFTNDLHLSNEGKEGGNDIDGTTGDWTIQEGQENLYIINHKNGKKFKIDLTEIV